MKWTDKRKLRVFDGVTAPPPQPEEPCDAVTERECLMHEGNPGWSWQRAKERARFWMAWYEERTKPGQRSLW